MSARIFISYRTADGVDKATALARDLGVVFGDEAVFLDKDDLRGGSAAGVAATSRGGSSYAMAGGRADVVAQPASVEVETSSAAVTARRKGMPVIATAPLTS